MRGRRGSTGVREIEIEIHEWELAVKKKLFKRF